MRRPRRLFIHTTLLCVICAVLADFLIAGLFEQPAGLIAYATFAGTLVSPTWWMVILSGWLVCIAAQMRAVPVASIFFAGVSTIIAVAFLRKFFNFWPEVRGFFAATVTVLIVFLLDPGLLGGNGLVATLFRISATLIYAYALGSWLP